MRRIPLALATATALTLTAACGGGDTDSPDTGAGGDTQTDGDAGGGGGTGDGGGEDLTPVTVGVIPIVDTAAIWLGVEEGIFEEHGLDVELEIAQGGAAILPAVVSGDYQFGFSNVVSLLVAADQGLPVQILAPGNATTGDTSADIGAVVTNPDTGIESTADLAGRTVAVNTLNNIGDATISHLVDEAGGDASSINFVEMGFPDMPAAVAGGQVDAAWVLEPFLSISQNQGMDVVTYNFAETDSDLLIAAYFTTGDYAESNPEVADAFTAAMEESLAHAEDNPDAARSILSTYTEIDPEVQESMVMPRFPSDVNTDALQLLADLSLEYGLVESEVDVESLIR